MDGFRKVHRVIAGLFLIAIPFAAYASFNGGKPEPFVYFPLPWLFGLTITGTWLLVRPWIQKRRSKAQTE